LGLLGVMITWDRPGIVTDFVNNRVVWLARPMLGFETGMPRRKCGPENGEGSVRAGYQSSRSRMMALAAVLIAATGALLWGVFADRGFRPSALGAMCIAAVTVVAVLVWPLRTAIALAVLCLTAGLLLLGIPAGRACDLPVAEFVSHALEDASGPHVHDRCQLESDRRSIAGLWLILGGIGGSAADALLLLARRAATRDDLGPSKSEPLL
jgi:hypothetical protein